MEASTRIDFNQTTTQLDNRTRTETLSMTRQQRKPQTRNNNKHKTTTTATTCLRRRRFCRAPSVSCGHSVNKKVAVFPHNAIHIVISLVCIFLLSTHVRDTHQDLGDYCPRACTCDDRSLEIYCKGQLDKGISGLPHILNPNTRRMTINNAQTSSLTGVDSVVKLEYLDLAYNKLTLIDFNDISQNNNLSSFNTSHNSISELRDSTIKNYLNERDISAHNMDKATEAIEVELRRKLPKISLVELDLSHNSLTILRNLTFVRLHKLQFLDLSHNQLTLLEDQSLYGLNSLERINLRANRLTQLPSIALQGTIRPPRGSQSDQSSLKYLDLSENMFHHLNDGAFNVIGKAQYIQLESCSIQTISDRAFDGLRYLQTLSLDKNSLRKIPSQSFADLSALRVLTMNDNDITSIEAGSFSDLVNLQELQITGGSFKELSAGTFNGLSNLQRLGISHNPNLVSVKPGAFKNLAGLTSLDLQSNSLPFIPADVNRNSLSTIDLRSNPLECGCELRWLTSWLRKFNDTIQAETRVTHIGYTKDQQLSYEPILMSQTLNLTCSGPPALAGQPVIDLPISKLECLEPSSELNVLIGYIALFTISTILILVCMTNFVQNKRHLFTLLKENLVQSHMPPVSPYTMNLHKNVDNLKSETQLYSSDYENIDYGPQTQIYTVHGDQMMYLNTQQQQQQQQYSQQI